MEFLKAFMNGGWLIDFASWIWNTMLLGWTSGLWHWHQQVSEVPWPLYLDTIISFCIATFLILCIWFILSWVALSLWVGTAVVWILAWCYYILAMIIIWFCVDVLWALLVWAWPFILFVIKWAIMLVFLPAVASETLALTKKKHSLIYVYSWMAYTTLLITTLAPWLAVTILIMTVLIYNTDDLAKI